MKILFFLFISIAIIGCKTYSSDDLNAFDKKIKAYEKKHNLNFYRSESGLYYKIIKQGKGDFIKYSDKVSFSYTGKLLNGFIFDRQIKPVTFNVDRLILGWKQVMLELKPGAKVQMIVPPSLAYGNRDLDDIPPNSILYFEMEIKNVE